MPIETIADGCPAPGLLRRMLDEAVDGPELDALERHVDDCPACQERLEAMTAETIGVPTTLGPLGGPPDDPAGATIPAAGGRAARAAEPPPEVPGYEIMGELGRGGMGVVYLARQARAGRHVALKMVLSGDRGRPDDLLRFRLEAESLARLQHPNIVQVYEVGDVGGRPFFSMEYVGGGTLADPPSGGPRPFAEAAALAETVARAVHAAHQAGVVHRDLKPANILLAARPDVGGDPAAGHSSGPGAGRPVPKVTDFGLAKVIGEDSGLTRTGQVMGTPSYMAPEQASGGAPVGVQADVYALGAILYQLLTGRPPFKGESPWETMMQVVHEPVAPPSRWRPGVPRDLEVICLKCLSKEPDGRYPSADALAEDIGRHLAGRPIAARPSGMARRAWLWARRHPAPAALAALLLASVVAGAAGALAQWRRAERNLLESRGNFNLARRAVDDLLTRISQDRLIAQPGFQALRRELLAKAAGFYREFAGRRLDDPTIRADVVRARTRLAEIDLAIGSPDRAEAGLREAVAAAGEAPRPPDLELARAAALVRLSSALGQRPRPAEALAAADQALASVRGLPDPARRGADARRQEAEVLVQRSFILGPLGRWDESERDARESIRLLADLARDRPGDAEIARDHAKAAINLTDILTRQSGRPEAALAALDDALGRCRAVAEGPDAGPNERAAISSVAIMRANYLGTVLGRWDDARSSMESARSLLETLAGENPLVTDYRYKLMNVDYTLGYIELRHARYREAAALYQKADDLIDRLVRDEKGGAARYATQRGGILVDLAEVRRHLGDPGGAAAILRDRCIPPVKVAAEAAPALTQLPLLHAMAHRYLAQALLDGGDAPASADAARRAEAMLGPVADAPGADALHREELARVRIALGDALRAEGRGPDAESALGRAIAILDDLNRANPDAPDRADALAYALARRSALRKARGDAPGADDDSRRGLGLIEPLPADDPDRLVRLAVARLNGGQTADRALDALRRADAAGLASPPALRADPDLAPLRGLPAFAEILARVEARSREASR